MPLHHNTQKKYVALKDSGLTAEELRKEMLAAELDPADVEKFISENYPGDGSEAPKEQPEVTSKKSGSKETTPIYEEWKMGRSYDAGGGVRLERVKKIKDVKIHHDRAERLNQHSENTLLQYSLKSN